MRNRRLVLIAALATMELWILGLMIRSVGGSRVPAAASPAGTLHIAYVAEAAEPEVLRSVETSTTPQVFIDDVDANITITARVGKTVAVTESTHLAGWVQGAHLPLTVVRTGDIVHIGREHLSVVVSMGILERRLAVSVPPGASVHVGRADAISLTGLRGSASLLSDRGSVEVRDMRGSLTARSADGRIELTDVDAPKLELSSGDGRIALQRVRSDLVDLDSSSGHVEIAQSTLRSGKIHTDDGRIRLGLTPDSNVTVQARTNSGKVVAAAPLAATAKYSANEDEDEDEDDDATSALVRIGSGSGRLDVSSGDGSITIFSGGTEQS